MSVEPSVTLAMAYGLLLGARHALEPDHLAAVATLAAHSPSRRDALRVAGAWGAGHASALLAAGLLLASARLPAWVVERADAAAGFLLIALGVWTVAGIRRRGLHAHRHAHDGRPPHVHFHLHAARGRHEPHLLPSVRRPSAAYMIGTVHGLAGSGAAVALAALAAPTRAAAGWFLLHFGLGSLAGIVAVAAAAVWPVLSVSARLPRVRSWVQSAAGLASVAAGVLLIAQAGMAP